MFRAIEANLVSGEEKPKSIPYLPIMRSVNVCMGACKRRFLECVTSVPYDTVDA